MHQGIISSAYYFMAKTQNVLLCTSALYRELNKVTYCHVTL